MSEESVFQQLTSYGVAPVIAIESVEAALPLADILLECGLPVAEITFRSFEKRSNTANARSAVPLRSR